MVAGSDAGADDSCMGSGILTSSMLVSMVGGCSGWWWGSLVDGEQSRGSCPQTRRMTCVSKCARMRAVDSGGCGRIRSSKGIETPREITAAAAGFSVNVSWIQHARPPTHCQSTALGGEQVRRRRKVRPDVSRETAADGLETVWVSILRLNAWYDSAAMHCSAFLSSGSALSPKRAAKASRPPA
jgi:hypothetical protein